MLRQLEMFYRQFQRKGLGQFTDEILGHWLVALPELLERRTMQEGRIPDLMRHLNPEILLLQKPDQRRSVGEIDAIDWIKSRIRKRMQHARNNLFPDVLWSDLLLEDIGILLQRIR